MISLTQEKKDLGWWLSSSQLSGSWAAASLILYLDLYKDLLKNEGPRSVRRKLIPVQDNQHKLGQLEAINPPPSQPGLGSFPV